LAVVMSPPINVAGDSLFDTFTVAPAGTPSSPPLELQAVATHIRQTATTIDRIDPYNVCVRSALCAGEPDLTT
jgi:hypothetical protein